jgi:hypothetical protein
VVPLTGRDEAGNLVLGWSPRAGLRRPAADPCERLPTRSFALARILGCRHWQLPGDAHGVLIRGGVGLDSRRDSGAALERERSRRRANGNGHLPGLTAEELAERGGLELGVLRTVLNDEQARRRVCLDPVTGRYRLARAAFDPATLATLAELELA